MLMEEQERCAWKSGKNADRSVEETMIEEWER
jgi:hypothetical protein